VTPLTTLMDRRLPQPPHYAGVPESVRERIESLIVRRNTCPDAEVNAIDAEAIELLLPYATGASDAEKSA
jgi:hypothetical protein